MNVPMFLELCWTRELLTSRSNIAWGLLKPVCTTECECVINMPMNCKLGLYVPKPQLCICNEASTNEYVCDGRRIASPCSEVADCAARPSWPCCLQPLCDAVLPTVTAKRCWQKCDIADLVVQMPDHPD